jgi:hypothetical protein
MRRLSPATAGHGTCPGFDFTGHMRRLCADMVSRLPELQHIRMGEVAICFCQTRSRAAHGMLASLTPMRFEGGSLFTDRGGQTWTFQRLYEPTTGREMLYILSFYLPRFLQQPLDEKLNTIFHELWHIGPRFDGDLRRFDGRCYMHSSSQRHYDQQMERLADKWLATGPPEALYDFLRADFLELCRRFGPVHGLKIRRPKLIPVKAAARR